MQKLETESFDYLSEVLTVAMEKFRVKNKADPMRLKWGRLIIQAVQVWGQLRNVIEVDELRARVEALEAA